MERVFADSHPPTHVVADAQFCLTFSTVAFPNAAAETQRLFGFLPASLDDLVSHWTKVRPDLLIGAFYPCPTVLTVLGDGVALDPNCSRLVKRAANLLGVTSVRRVLIWEFKFDAWSVETPAMLGRVPGTLYHGTNDLNWKGIEGQGLGLDHPPNWAIGGRRNVYLTATPQTAAFHARRTVREKGGSPIVLACRRPWKLKPDWDVLNQLVNNASVPSSDADELTREADLFASPRPVSRFAILEAKAPVFSQSYAEWPVIWQAGRVHRSLGWVLR